MEELVKLYIQNDRLMLTESDLVNRAFSMIFSSDILEKHKLAIHSELRPFKGEQSIQGGKWQSVKQINYAAKFDLALIDKSVQYWEEAYTKVLDAQSRRGKRRGIQYWRFLVYPLEAHKVVFEFKKRLKGKYVRIFLRNIYERA